MCLVNIVKLKIERELVLGSAIETANFTRYLRTVNPELSVEYQVNYAAINDAVHLFKGVEFTDANINWYLYHIAQLLASK